MYYNENPDENLYQGDILHHFPIVILPDQLEIARPIIPTKVSEGLIEAELKLESELPDAFSKGTELILASAYSANIMILSQTCDIDHREFVAVAPIFPLEQVEGKSRRDAVKENRVNHRFYLPPVADFVESYVDFTVINSVKRSRLNVANRIASLSDLYRHHLAEALHGFFCRPFLP